MDDPRSFVCLFIRSFDLSGQGSIVQPTMDPGAETFISVQCASSGRGGELPTSSPPLPELAHWTDIKVSAPGSIV